jgi:hypothetical protein
MGKRYSMFYLLGCVASALSGILAYGVSRHTFLAASCHSGYYHLEPLLTICKGHAYGRLG